MAGGDQPKHSQVGPIVHVGLFPRSTGKTLMSLNQKVIRSDLFQKCPRGGIMEQDWRKPRLDVRTLL